MSANGTGAGRPAVSPPPKAVSSHNAMSSLASSSMVTAASNKISCLACRTAKRRCSSTSVETVCNRCAKQDLQCLYKTHERGRKKRKVDTETGDTTGPADLTTSSSQDDLTLESTMAHKPGESAELARRTNAPSTSALSPPALPGPSPSRIEHQRSPSSISTSSASRANPKIKFSHVIPAERDSSPHLAGKAEDEADEAEKPLYAAVGTSGNPAKLDASEEDHHYALVERLLRTECRDPIDLGLLTEFDTQELFDFYFRFLNLTITMLDPALHAPPATCRARSKLLFSAIITVASRIVRPKVYLACLLLTNKLVGQAVEDGSCNVEFIQALNILAQWKRAEDSSSWRRVGYAIRMAQELKLNVKASRPLPQDERAARELLNRERTWLNLIIADYHLAIHHSLPRIMGSDEGGSEDPVHWVERDHPPALGAPGEVILAPMIEFSRMCRLYADMLPTINGDPSNLRMLGWIELQSKRWRERWLSPINFTIQRPSPTAMTSARPADRPIEGLPEAGHGSSVQSLTRSQTATLKICDAYYRFHIAEYRLLFHSRFRASSPDLDLQQPGPLSFALGECIETGLNVSQVFLQDIVGPGDMLYCFNLCWVSLAVTSVWLAKNIHAMPDTEQTRVARIIGDVQSATRAASRSKNDMPAYTSRLLEHLLERVRPLDCRLNSLATAAVAADSHGDQRGQPRRKLDHQTGVASAGKAGAEHQAMGLPLYAPHHSSQQYRGSAAPSAPGISVTRNPYEVEGLPSELHAGTGQFDGHPQTVTGDVWATHELPPFDIASAQHHPLSATFPHHPTASGPGHMPSSTASSSTPSRSGPHIAGLSSLMMEDSFGPNGNLFPPHDDEFWRMLLPSQTGLI